MYKEVLVIGILSALGISCIPAFFIFLDYHKRSNVHKALLSVVTLFSLVVLLAITPAGHLILVALATPLLLAAYVFFARRR